VYVRGEVGIIEGVSCQFGTFTSRPRSSCGKKLNALRVLKHIHKHVYEQKVTSVYVRGEVGIIKEFLCQFGTLPPVPRNSGGKKLNTCRVIKHLRKDIYEQISTIRHVRG